MASPAPRDVGNGTRKGFQRLLDLHMHTMNFERFTVSASKRIQEAQTLAISSGNPIIESAHLLAVMLDAQDSINNEVLRRMSKDTRKMRESVTELLSRSPKISG